MSKSNGGFYWDDSTALTAGKFTALQTAGIVHAITTRKWEHSMLALTDPQSAAGLLADATGLKKSAWMKQVHQNRVLRVESAGLAGQGDAMITNVPGLGLVARSADCPMILLVEKDAGAIGIVHSGWRGTVAKIPAESVREMVAHYDCDPARITACLCPSAGPCCYQTGEELMYTACDNLGPSARKFFIKKDNSLNFDLWACITDQLLRVGLKKANIHNANLCTLCHNNIFPSFRTEGDGAGRFQAIIAMKD